MEYHHKFDIRDKIDAPFSNAKDVSKILGHSEMNKALREHIDKDEKKPLSGATAKSPSTHNEGKAIYISESGLYDLILQSRLPAAKSFKKWVTSEIPPSICKTGGYKLQII